MWYRPKQRFLNRGISKFTIRFYTVYLKSTHFFPCHFICSFPLHGPDNKPNVYEAANDSV